MAEESIRSRWEAWEEQTLSPYATLSKNSRGRAREIEPCEIRTCFMRDRDRILHCKAFRRLKHKTQVFLAPLGDHYRTRLTHTLEVSQIARTISRAMGLNEDLTEAIALGHDLGHTPFGHTGEGVLDRLVPGGFSHNEEGLRVVDKLENDGQGLNLTFEVRDGIVNHPKKCHPATMEGKVVSLSDRIAYVNHDIDDAVRAGVLKGTDIPDSCRRRFGNTHSERINSMILDVLRASRNTPAVTFTEEAAEEFDRLRNFMYENVYFNPIAKREDEKARGVVEALYTYYLDHIELLPEEFLLHLGEDGAQRITADYIACMTDTYAIQQYQQLFVPAAWN